MVKVSDKHSYQATTFHTPCRVADEAGHHSCARSRAQGSHDAFLYLAPGDEQWTIILPWTCCLLQSVPCTSLLPLVRASERAPAQVPTLPPPPEALHHQGKWSFLLCPSPMLGKQLQTWTLQKLLWWDRESHPAHSSLRLPRLKYLWAR